MIQKTLEKIANIVLPKNTPLGITKGEGFVQYWMNDRYSNTTLSIIYNIEENQYEYQNIIIKGVVDEDM